MVFSFALASGLGMGTPQGVPMKIDTPSFQEGKTIPKKYTCQGSDVSPPLFFHEAPQETVSFALIVDDPDAPGGTFDHWIVWNIPGNVTSLAESAKVPNQGTNSYGELRYRGPCPPPGKPHHYHFKLYALDIKLTLPEGITKKELERAIEGHVLAQAELIGIFQREKK